MSTDDMAGAAKPEVEVAAAAADTEDEEGLARPKKRGRPAAAGTSATPSSENAAATEASDAGPSTSAAAAPKPRSASRPTSKAARAAAEAAQRAAAGYELFTCGSSDWGALGRGKDVKISYRAAQVHLPNNERVTQVACGAMHTAALSASGQVWTFGANVDGALGRPTKGSPPWAAEHVADEEDEAVPGRFRLPAGRVAKAVTAGDGFTMVLCTDGTAWGAGLFKDAAGGQNGFQEDDGGAATQPICVWTPAVPKQRIMQLVAGTCHAAALTEEGELLTWGIGTQGQLGRLPEFSLAEHQAPDMLFKPAPATAGVQHLFKSKIKCISAGGRSTFVVSHTNRVAAAGLNDHGQLGIESNDKLSWAFAEVVSLKPFQITAIAGGEHHSLALTKGKRVVSFGAAVNGVLGRSGVDVDDATNMYPKPTLVDGMRHLHIRSLAADERVSGVTTDDGELFMWGSNVTFQLGRGNTQACISLPERLEGTDLPRFVALSFGRHHTAMLAKPVDAATDAAEAGSGLAAAATATAAVAAPAGADVAAVSAEVTELEGPRSDE